MYLTKRTYVKNWKHTPRTKRYQISIKQGNKKLESIDPKKISYIIEEVGYWRKANAIHKWFVANVQEGNDDCKEYHVDTEAIEGLLDTVNTVLKASKLIKGKTVNGYTFDGKKEIPNYQDGKVIEDPSTAESLLPTSSGFFFGGLEYDEYYYRDLKDTKKILEYALKHPESDYYYQSSW